MMHRNMYRNESVRRRISRVTKNTRNMTIVPRRSMPICKRRSVGSSARKRNQGSRSVCKERVILEMRVFTSVHYNVHDRGEERQHGEELAEAQLERGEPNPGPADEGSPEHNEQKRLIYIQRNLGE